jgi:hypothetical protein
VVDPNEPGLLDDIGVRGRTGIPSNGTNDATVPLKLGIRGWGWGMTLRGGGCRRNGCVAVGAADPEGVTVRKDRASMSEEFADHTLFDKWKS